MGGFVSGPGGIASWLSRKPLLIHEQNAILGLTNRLLQFFATTRCSAFPHVFNKQKSSFLTGNPVRQDILNLPSVDERYEKRQGALRLLILGGSLGAQKLNQLIPQALTLSENPIEVWHQCGQRHLVATQAAYQAVNLRIFCLADFIEDMAKAYTWADVVICRAGALTISELSAVGIPALFIPYPYAVDNHQYFNAYHLQQCGAADIVNDSELSAENLAAWLNRQSRETAWKKACLAFSQAKPNATKEIIEHLKKAIKDKI
jgi:UDP-N-acetylglucosamine--N-acetylmuramyl-(pentapeptide) pyrophosphoryl-undecaprenol N-acetylglucosamine transferase